VRDHEEAEDVFALFAENVWRGLPGWEARASARAWAYRVAWNAATRSFRDPWRRRRAQLRLSAASRLAAAVMTTSRRNLEARKDRLDALRQTLTQEEQSLLVLRVDRGLSWNDVAEAMGVDDGPSGRAALRKRFERLKEKLAREARARGMLGEA
jgi:RNA polymerase sigma-70 factor (ECF subfamily)